VPGPGESNSPVQALFACMRCAAANTFFARLDRRLPPIAVLLSGFVCPVAASAVAPSWGQPIVVAQHGIKRSVLLHWEAIMRASGGGRKDAVRFLVEFDWMRKEARRLHLTVTRKKLRREYRQVVRSYGPKQLRRMLRESHQTRADLRERTDSAYYARRLRKYVATRKGEDQAALDSYAKRFHRRWRSRTRCRTRFYIRSHCG
jgi:hypothetical protein